MLVNHRLISTLRKAGYQAGYGGESALNCPHKDKALSDPWMRGHTEGMELRRCDVPSGTHPDLTPQREFGVETGHRKSKPTH
jgi:ribosome modulation factor